MSVATQTRTMSRRSIPSPTRVSRRMRSACSSISGGGREFPSAIWTARVISRSEFGIQDRSRAAGGRGPRSWRVGGTGAAAFEERSTVRGAGRRRVAARLRRGGPRWVICGAGRARPRREGPGEGSREAAGDKFMGAGLRLSSGTRSGELTRSDSRTPTSSRSVEEGGRDPAAGAEAGGVPGGRLASSTRRSRSSVVGTAGPCAGPRGGAARAGARAEGGSGGASGGPSCGGTGGAPRVGAGHQEGPAVCTEETAAATERVSAHAAVRASKATRRGSPALSRWLC